VNAELFNWWGFRVRLPAGFEARPITKAETVIFGLLVAIVLEAAWVIWLALRPLDAAGYQSAVVRRYAVPLALTVIPVVLMILTPRDLLQRTWIGMVLVHSRERGDLRGWDLGLVSIAVVGVILLVFRPQVSFWATALVMLIDVGLVCFGASFLQDRLDFSKRRWRFELPGWLGMDREDPLRPDEPSPDEGDEDVVEGPEPGADPLMPVAIEGQEKPEMVGICLSPELISRLRAINAEEDGRLFHREPHAVVLVDRDPAKDEGRDEIIRLCRQFASISRRHALSRMQFANLILGFVQEVIPYELDEDSTAGFPGGPFSEYGRFALETVHDQVGDCECTGILCLSLLAYLGYKVALVHVKITDPKTGEVEGHAAVGLDIDDDLFSGAPVQEGFDCISATDGSGSRYLYGESAIDGGTMAFGSIPQDWAGNIEVRKVVPISATQ